MALDFQRARPLLQNGNLTKLFVEELGWEHCRQKLTLRAGESDFAFTAVAEKRGFTAWLCASADGQLPDHTTRLKLDRALTQTSFEHLIVFATQDYAQQSWMWVRREPGRPIAARTHEFHHSQPGDSLLQKLQILFVSLEEEEAGLSVTEIASRARAAFDIERVTKAFYRDFDTHRKTFLKFIDGIGEVADCEWYASVMLNRLMFVYFIQRKGFLDGDHDYLRNRLDRCKREQGKDKFYTFYRYFLLRLFHEGFGKRRKDRAPDLEKLVGNIPYLNGGLFDVHELERPERYGKDITIEDKAFERIFNYFDQYQWHLDERPLRADNEINPDVLGYIFEKYINQKQMGAYYTKEDITEYISKNTVLPFLFDAARAKCKVAFENPNGPTVWDLLRDNPDRYIYDAVKRGVAMPLPKVIEAGIKDVSMRGGWNKPAPAEYALPTEIWREVIARRRRYEEIRRKLAAGEVREVNDFITLNLDLRQFAQDVVLNCEGPDLLMALWQAITTITVLDPTGGSGAFIFAALNILEPLYEACLDRMEAFLAEWGENGKKSRPNYHKKFTEVLARVDAHPNRRYFVLKSIILNNLYAVDIMEEAVEICKLRLFLKLAAQVDPHPEKDNLGIEPLPDIDFNIRAGNSLVGYATKEEVQRCMKELGGGQMKLMGEDELGNFSRFNTRCADVEQAFSKFRQLQTEGDGSVPHADKQELQKRLQALEVELNRHLAGEYGVNAADEGTFAKWVKLHQPFHWFIQFYGIITSGGFDVIIGNPPYVNFRKVEYRIPANYACFSCGDLFAICTERSYAIGRDLARIGLIIPLSATSTDTMSPLKLCINKLSTCAWTSYFSASDQPASLFSGVRHRLMVLLSQKGNNRNFNLQTTRFIKWFNPERDGLFGSFITYAHSTGRGFDPFCKLSTPTEISILEKLFAKKSLAHDASKSGSPIHYHNAPVHWGKVFDFVPHFRVGSAKPQQSSHLKTIYFEDRIRARVALCLLNSSLFYWFNWQYSNCRDLSSKDILRAPLDIKSMRPASMKQLEDMADALMKDFKKHKSLYSRVVDGVTTEFDSFYPAKSKAILDQIDAVLAVHYGFTAEELDFLLNYDIKYRLGRDTEAEGE